MSWVCIAIITMTIDKESKVPFATESVPKMSGHRIATGNTLSMIMEKALVHFIGVMVAGIPATDEPSFRVSREDFLRDDCVAIEWHYDIA